ncbi:MAG TPA: type II secretion system F family protein [Candidatus Methylacidiphilales bacterium]|nr:type II secretion system F family protein [Candidatus Methylacidiphilales bacterium]
MTLRARIRFYQQMAVLTRAGLPLRASIERLRDRLGSRQLALLAQKLGEGERLAESFAAAGFPPFETNLVAAGERSGHLDTICDRIALFWQRELEFRQALIAPLVYPIVVLHLSVLLSSAAVLISQPWTAAVEALIFNLMILEGSLLTVYVLARATWTSPAMKTFWLRLPIVGSALRAAFAYRWITALRIEFGAGVSLYRAVGDAWRSSGFVNGERLGQEGEEAMRSGASLVTLVTQWRQLPRDWIDFIETGEISGKFEEAFLNLEAEAARNWTLAQQRMSNWLPKIVYFFALIVVAWQVVEIGIKVYIEPIEQVEDALKNN